MSAIKGMDRSSSLRPAICSLSLGRAVSHALEPKLRAASDAGFQGIELFYEDIKLPARAACAADPTLSFSSALLAEAYRTHRLCLRFHLRIISLQPFKNFEGLLSPQRRAQKLAKLRVWIQLAHALRTDTIVIPSMWANHAALCTADPSAIVRDLREAATLCAAASPPLRIAYENMAWGAHVSSWQDMWGVVEAVDRPNVGLCLDTFQILARCWADPTRDDGLREGVADDPDAAARRELSTMIATVPLCKVFCVQLSDAKRISGGPASASSIDAGPLRSGHPLWVEGQHPLMTWSRNARLFPAEADRGAYLPVLELVRSWVLDWGYRGFMSMEVFDPAMFERGEGVPVALAERGQRAWLKCLEAVLGEEEGEEEGEADDDARTEVGAGGGSLDAEEEEYDKGKEEEEEDKTGEPTKAVVIGGLDGAADERTIDARAATGAFAVPGGPAGHGVFAAMVAASAHF